MPVHGTENNTHQSIQLLTSVFLDKLQVAQPVVTSQGP